jgi:hypothetical protein
MFRAPKKTCLLAAALLWASATLAGSRVTLLPFDGDSAKPLRWRVAQLLKRSGHTVLGFSPSRNPESRSDLQAYAQRRDVEAFVSGQAAESPNGWELSLAVLDASGKPKGAPIKFHAANLNGLVKELKAEGQGRLDEAMRGQAGPVTVLPLPRRARPARAASPPPDPTSDEASDTPAPAAPRGPAPAASESSWDADAANDADEPRKPSKAARKRPGAAPPSKEQAPAAPAPSAPTRDRGSAALRLAMASSAATPSSSAASRGTGGKAAPVAESRDSAEPARRTPAKSAGAEPAPRTADKRDLTPMPGEVDLDADSASGEIEDAAAAPAEPSAISDGPKDAADAPPAKTKRLSLFGRRSAKTPAVGESSTAGGSEEGGGTPEDRESGESKSAAKAKLPSAIVGVEAGLVRRDLKYSDDLYRRLRAPTTNGWVYRFDAEFFPFARPVKERLSLLATYESTLAGKVHDTRVDRNFNVNFSELSAGMRVRQAFGPHEVGLQVTLGRLNTGLEDPEHLSGVPEFTYVLVTPSLDGKLRFGPATLQASVGYRRALGSYGEASSADWFPHMDGYGIDGRLGLEYRISDQVAFQFAGSMRRFILTMNSKPSDAVGGVAEVAAGAVDSYLAGYFGLSLTL